MAESPMSGLASVGAEAGEVEPDRHFHRRGEPALAGAADADAEVGAVAHMAVTIEARAMLLRRIGHRSCPSPWRC